MIYIKTPIRSSGSQWLTTNSWSDCLPTVSNAVLPPKTAISGQLSQKSVDSGFSDHSDCRETQEVILMMIMIILMTVTTTLNLCHPPTRCSWRARWCTRPTRTGTSCTMWARSTSTRWDPSKWSASSPSYSASLPSSRPTTIHQGLPLFSVNTFDLPVLKTIV